MDIMEIIKNALIKYIFYPSRRIIKGLIIILWLYVLIALTLAYSSGNSANLILEFFDTPDSGGPFQSFATRSRITRNLEGDFDIETYRYVSYRDLIVEYMNNYHAYSDYPPPIENVILTLFDGFSFSTNLVPNPTEVKAEFKKEFMYQQREALGLFSKIDHRLNAAASDISVDPEDIVLRPLEVVPTDWRSLIDPTIKEKEIKLPIEVVNWVKLKRKELSYIQSRDSLTNTFVLLMVLGAFGSLIFLIRDYIKAEGSSSVEAYIFRPVLGCLLAVAMFVVDIAAHTVISGASIFSIRHETLYLLAFAAGLLSEQAYLAVDTQASTALTRVFKKNQSSDTTDQVEEKKPDADHSKKANGNSPQE